MKSPQIKDKNPDVNGRAFQLGDFPQTNLQKAVTILRHRMADRKVLDMITERIQDPPTLAELASFSGSSRTLFKAVIARSANLRKYR